MTKSSMFGQRAAATKLLLYISVISLPWGAANGQGTSSGLRIVSPENGSVYAAGDTIPITVSVAPGSQPGTVGVIGEDMGFSSTKTGAPYTFLLTVPSDLCGPKRLTAYNFIGPGKGVFSAPVDVDIEPTATLLSMKVNLSTLQMKFSGVEIPLLVEGSFSDGSVLDITQSSRTNYVSMNRDVVNVSSSGLVTARANGPKQTAVLVSYEGSSLTVPVSIPGPVPFESFTPRTAALPAGILTGVFSLGTGSDGIDPVAEPTTIQIGTQQILIPSNSFTEDEHGRFSIRGKFADATVNGWIVPMQGGRFEFKFAISQHHVRLENNPTVIGLLIGDDGSVVSSVPRH